MNEKSTVYIRLHAGCFIPRYGDTSQRDVKDLGTLPGSLSESLALATSGGFALSILDCYRNPLFVIDRSGGLVYCNRAGIAVLRTKAGFAVRQGKLHLGARPVDAVLQGAFAAAPSAGDTVVCCGIRFPRLNGTRDWLVLVRGLEAAVSEGRVPWAFLLHAIARTTPRSLPFQVLEDLFGLTRRETVVVSELLRSGTLRAAAQRLSLSTETVRSHLKKAFQKCDVHSRAELIALLQGVTEFAGD